MPDTRRRGICGWPLKHKAIAAGAIENKIVLAGGYATVNDVDVYDLKTRKWEKLALSEAKVDAAAAAAGNTLLTGGGSGGYYTVADVFKLSQ